MTTYLPRHARARRSWPLSVALVLAGAVAAGAIAVWDRIKDWTRIAAGPALMITGGLLLAVALIEAWGDGAVNGADVVLLLLAIGAVVWTLYRPGAR